MNNKLKKFNKVIEETEKLFKNKKQFDIHFASDKDGRK